MWDPKGSIQSFVLSGREHCYSPNSAFIDSVAMTMKKRETSPLVPFAIIHVSETLNYGNMNYPRGGRGSRRGRNSNLLKVPLRGLFADGVWQCNCDPRVPADHFQTKNGGKNHGRWCMFSIDDKI